MFFIIAFISYCLCNINIMGSNFVFALPWILFCFLFGKNYGTVSYLVSFIVMGSFNRVFYLIMLGFLATFVIFRCFLKLNSKKLFLQISFYDFVNVFIGSLISMLLMDNFNIIYCFFLSVGSYWLMRCFCDLYLNITKSSDVFNFSYNNTVFLLFISGVCFLGLNLRAGVINISFIVITLLSFVAGRIGKEEGIMYSFLLFVMFVLHNYNVDFSILLFLSTSLFSSFFNRVSKLTLVFTYILMCLGFVYYFKLDYLLLINYIISSIIYLFVPSFVIDKFAGVCEGSENFGNRISEEHKKFSSKLANKIIDMEEVFSLVCKKIDVKGRLKKSDRLLLSEEVNVFGDILSSFSEDITKNHNDVCCKIEQELYKFGFDLLNLYVKENVFKNKVISLSIRCEKKDIERLILPLISRIIKRKMRISDIKYNDIFDYYNIVFKECKNNMFKYGVSQKAKNGKVCGDSYLVYENDDSKMFLISDGMGFGSLAKKRSKQAIDIFKKFIDIGFDVEHSIVSLNHILKGDFSKDSYTTFDLFVYDKYKEEFYFYKNGACDSYVISNDITVIEGDDLPLGIMDKIQFKKNKIELKNGDYVIMVSDGVKEETINNLKNSDPQKMCNEIISRQNEIVDDESVIVIKINK